MIFIIENTDLEKRKNNFQDGGLLPSSQLWGFFIVEER